MSTELQQQATQSAGLRAWIGRPDVHAQLAAAVGDVMDADQFVAHMLIAFQDDKVKQCSDKSKYTALFECAALTLLPTLGQVVLIPYKQEIKSMPQWQGLKALMERHPSVLEVTGHLVHTGDDFAVLNGEVRHSYDPFAEARIIDKPADIKGGYCKIVYRDGRPPRYHFVTVRQISKAQKCAQTQKVWVAWYEQMAIKTLYRDCYARRAVPMDPLVQSRMEKALRIEDANMGNDPSRVLPDSAPDDMRKRLEAATAETPPATVEPDESLNQPEPPFNPPTPNEAAVAEKEAEAEVTAETVATRAKLFDEFAGEFATGDASRVAQLSTQIDAALERGDLTRPQWLKLFKEASNAKGRLSKV